MASADKCVWVIGLVPQRRKRSPPVHPLARALVRLAALKVQQISERETKRPNQACADWSGAENIVLL
jgi:hypothetical protein